MPYDQNSELPESVRNHLPVHAQAIFREAFNHAFAAHSAEPDCEQRAFRIAWSAVKRTYEKRDGELGAPFGSQFSPHLIQINRSKCGRG